jgi:hypothetical protein
LCERVGESRFLSKIATSDAVYTIPVSGVAIIEAARKADGASHSSANSDNN